LIRKETIMALQVFLAMNLRRYSAAYSTETGYEVAVKSGTTVRDLTQLLRIPGEEVKLTFANGVAVPWETALEGNERVALFPAVGGG
jgi:sulfur carrier protein ThiS